jgi:autotransporter-associated beta strand protein
MRKYCCRASPERTATDRVDIQNGIGLRDKIRTITVNDNPNSSTDIARISGLVTTTTNNGGLTKNGAGTLELTNNNNSYIGTTTVTEGVLSIPSIANSGGGNSAIGNVAADRATITLGAAATGGSLLYTGTNNSSNRPILLGGAGGGTVSSSTDNLTLTGGIFTNGNALRIGGGGTVTVSTTAIQGASGTLTKRDSGTLVLSSGVTHTYSGVTNIVGGTAVVNGTLNSGGGLVTVGDGVSADTGVLMGTGSISRSVTVAKGGAISPGTSPGILKTNGETWQGGGTYLFELKDAAGTAGTGFDQLQLNGALSVSASAGNRFFLDITSLDSGNTNADAANFNKSQDYSWIIATTTSAVTIDPTAFTLVDHFTNDTTGVGAAPDGAFSIAGAGNNVELHYTAAPEPGTMSLLAIGLSGFLSRRPKRKRAI